MCYYLEKHLIAVSVVDITEKGLHSVYFFFDPDLKVLNMGIFSALVEIEWVKRINIKFPEF